MKYELVPVEFGQEEKTPTQTSERAMFRVRALRDIPAHEVQKGDLGGLIENEENLCQEGDAWVSFHARVIDEARVEGNALVTGEALIEEEALVSGNAFVGDSARIGGSAFITDDVKISGEAHVSGSMSIVGKSRIGDTDNIRIVHPVGPSITPSDG